MGKQASLKNLSRKQLYKLIRKQDHEVKRLQAAHAESVRQAPSKFPTPSEFARSARQARKQRAAIADSSGAEVSGFEAPSYPREAVSHSRENRDLVEELEDFESTAYDDMFDWDYDDLYDDVGEEEEDGYGEDAAK